MNPDPFEEERRDDKKASGCVVVIFGVTGDLAKKKLLPALYSLYREEYLDRFAVVGFARRPWTDGSFRDEAAEALRNAASAAKARSPDSPEAENPAPAAGSAADPVVAAFLSRLQYVSAPFEDAAGYARLAEKLKGCWNDGLRTFLYYLAVPPENYSGIAERLGRMRPLLPDGIDERIIIEKPFGTDGASARALDESIQRWFREDRIFRIDHYLGKETVQNVIAFRFGNGVFEPVWNSRYVDAVEITVAETEGVASRAGYYERAGALRDMVQNHLLQLLALTAMEPPNDLSPRSIRAEKLKVFRAIGSFDGKGTEMDTVRAQYTEGTIDGRPVDAYVSEKGIAPHSATETYVALKIRVDTWRWSGTPFYLRVGKRLPRRLSEIAVRFRRPPHAIFPGPGGAGNALVFRIQPDEGFSLSVNAKIPGFSTSLRSALMDFSYGAGFADAPRDAYERLLLDALRGDPSLYASSEEIEACWDVVDPVLRAWAGGKPSLARYPAGSAGPDEARVLIERDGRRWRRL